MGTKIIPPNASFETLLNHLILPVMSGLQGFFLPHESPSKAAKNWAIGKDDGVVVGSPTYAAGYVSLESNSVAYIETPVVETPEMTILFAGRGTTDSSTADLTPVFVSSRTAAAALGGAGGIQVYADTASRQRVYFSQWDGGSAQNAIASVNSYSINTWEFISARVTATTARIRNLTTGVIGADLVLSGTRNPGSGKIRIGSMIDATWKGKSDAALCGLYNRALTDAEEVSMYNWAKTYLATKGISI